MRWDELFGDLEAQFEAAENAELDAETADRTRRELAKLRLVDRLRPSIGHPVGFTTLGAGVVRGRLVDVGAEWLLVAETSHRQALIPLPAVLAVAGLGVRSAVPDSEGPVVAGLGLGYAVRRLAQDRLPVQCVLRDATTVTGIVDRVGQDFLEVAEHYAGELRRRGEASTVRAVAFDGLALIRSEG